MASSHEVLTTTSHSTMESNDYEEPLQPENIKTDSPPSTTNKSWHDIKESVSMSRRIHAHFANKVPHDFKFMEIDPTMYPNRRNMWPRDVENYSTRVFFLGVLQGQRENQLLYVDLPKESDSSVVDKAVDWKPVVAMYQRALQPVYSKEEELLRERKRVGVHGVTSYDIADDKSRVFFPAGGDMFYIDSVDLGRLNASVPKFPKFKNKGVRMDAKMSPQSANLVAYIQDNDIWIKHFISGDERRMTFAHRGLKDIVKDPVSAGCSSYVVQEEFDRYTGYWWQPGNSAGTHRILFEEVDESEIQVLHIANPLTQPDVDSYRYPRAGTKNAKVTLKTLEFTTTEDGLISEPVIKKLKEPLEILFPWMEYVVRLGWLSSGIGVWAQLLDRTQQRTAVIYIPIDLFDLVVEQKPESPVQHQDTSKESQEGEDVEMKEDGEGESQTRSKIMRSQALEGVKILISEYSDIWINVHDTFYFYKHNKSSDEINFIWASERTGHRHLYRINCQLNITSDDPLKCVTTETTLTSGEWEVLENVDSVWVNEEEDRIFFMGLKDTPLETHLYMVNNEDPSNPTRLTRLGRSHTVCMSEDCKMFVTVSSSTHELYSAQLYRLSAQQRPVLSMNLLEALDLTQEYKPPELFSFDSSCGVKMHGMVHKPLEAEPGVKYPTVLYVYGGPRVQLVTNSFKGLRYQRLFTLAALGYTVVSIDGRGSTHRGLKFEGHVKNRLGQVEIEDQIEGLKHAAEMYECVDLNRVAIHGWSYGGYLSLMGLTQRPDIFKIGIAGAPVSCWKMYDTGYTERYLGMPESNPDGYEKGSPLKWATRFPNEPNRLFLVQGLIDENVHFVHIAHLVNALVRYCKPYQLQIYPGERHGIRSPESNEHFEVVVISYLQQYL